MNNNPPSALESKLALLSLTTISRNIEQMLSDAATRNWSAAATLDWLADIELSARRDRAIERRFRSARLGARQTIDSFQFSHHKSRQQAKPRILRLLDLEFLRQGTNIVIIGNPDPETFCTSLLHR